MSDVPDSLKYTSDHEYVRTTDDAGTVVIGITDYAQGELGDIVFLNLPSVGETFGEHAAFGTIEAVKAVSELFTPFAGEVTEVNGALDEKPETVNQDPYGNGWMIRFKLDDPGKLDSLMSAADYKKHIGE